MNAKKILILFIGLMGITLTAQEQLRVEYELIEPEENFRDPDLPPGIEFKIPKRYFELIVNKEESIWKSIERVSNEQNEDKGTMVAVVSFPPSGDFYKNVQEKIKIQEVKAFSKNYLVKDNLEEYNWQLTRETKKVLGIQVQKATFSDEENGEELVAWYAPKLNFKNGPDEFSGLPGLILEIEVITHYEDNSKGSQTYVATKVEALKSNKKIVPPTKGIVVTQEELNIINQENLERMRKMQESGVDKD